MKQKHLTRYVYRYMSEQGLKIEWRKIHYDLNVDNLAQQHMKLLQVRTQLTLCKPLVHPNDI